MNTTQHNSKTNTKKTLLLGALLTSCAFLLSACADPGKGVPLGELVSSEIFAGSTIAGDANGQGTAARFTSLTGIAIAPNGNIYVTNGARTRKITVDGLVSTYTASNSDSEDVTTTVAKLSSRDGMAMDPYGNTFVADAANKLIRRLNPAGKPAITLKDLAGPTDIAITSKASTAYVTDGNRVLRLRFR